MPMSPEQVAYQTAHIHEDKRPNIRAAISSLTALSTLAIFLRVYVRCSTRAGLHADDYTILAAGIVTWLTFVSIFFETKNGLGLHLIAVSEHQFTNILKGILFSGPGFHLSILLTQLSLVFLYKRIFTTHKPWFKYTLYVLGVFSVLQNLAVILTVMFYCVPFNYYWNKSIKGGRCYKFQVVYLIGLAMNLITDTAILLAPLPIIWGLQMNSSSKKAITFIFLLGGFVCITNIIRLPYTIYIPTEDFTWTDVSAATWAQAEACVGIVCACLPCYRPLFKSMAFTASTNRPAQSTQTRSKIRASETYKTLGEQEPSGTGSRGSSKIELVSHEQWKSPTPQTKTTAQGPAGNEDIEAGISQNIIKVTHEVDVSSKDVR